MPGIFKFLKSEIGSLFVFFVPVIIPERKMVVDPKLQLVVDIMSRLE